MPQTIYQKILVYSAFVKAAFLAMLAYRLRYYTGIITYILFVCVQYFIWKAVYSNLSEDQHINGFTLPEMITYVSVAWITRSFYFSTIDDDIDDLVRSGQISVFLLRPINFHLTVITQAAGESLFRIIFFSLPISIAITSLFPVSLPHSVGDFLLFSLATLGSFLITAEINFLVGLLAFRLKSIQGVARAKYSLIQLFSGLLMPLTFFPDWFRSIVDLLPFQMITFVPLEMYLGHVSTSGAFRLLAHQLYWALGLILVSQFFWRRALTKLTLQGG